MRQIIFVDPSIDNAEQMVQGLYSLVSGKTEGLGGLARRRARARSCRCCAAMTPDHRAGRPLWRPDPRILGQHKDLAAVQIMSHGSAGSLTLGSATLGQGQLDSYKDQLRAGRRDGRTGRHPALRLQRGRRQGGVAFVDSLSAITRADVAAATLHTVGSAALGGDWVLDYRHGAIEATTLTVRAGMA